MFKAGRARVEMTTRMDLRRLVSVVACGALLGGSVLGSPAAARRKPRCFGKTATIVGSARGDTVSGTPGDDVIVSLGGSDTIDGGGGDDRICSGKGADTILGGQGGDRMEPGGGGDLVSGGDGQDTISYASRSAHITIIPDEPKPTLSLRPAPRGRSLVEDFC